MTTILESSLVLLAVSLASFAVAGIILVAWLRRARG